MSSFQGIWVPIVTPFHNGAIDFAALRRLSAHLLESGVAGLVVCGTTGEAAALDKDEQLAVLDAVLEQAPAGRVIMGLAGNNLKSLLNLQTEILKRPVAALLVPAPYYIRPSQAALESFFHSVADASSVPLIVYDIPYRTGVNLDKDTLLNIVRHPRIAAVKDCGGNLDKTLALLASGTVEVLCGEDLQLFSALCLGASGAIAAAAHIRPELFVQLQRQVRDQQLDAARTTFRQLVPLIQALFAEPNPAPVKALLAHQGLIEPHLRAPMHDCSAATAVHLQNLLADLP
ncbi:MULTISPECIES: 4-hydroxy-tetrahydrodipicolinate synthase [Pseudomonas]|uniref:4-hydroxy-tetrahydrodipicolinate synthase n=1 Tax=Pseudomonas TaxID=286 RepID=UPI000E1E4EDC|nr:MULTISPECIES: 4-hydroxy-tetrahydrodipicolinate synthase [Pseudomonas]AXK57335.1 4-hydroxy-tetrahydrodipicolinate synthase [Pseudomonas protegens]MDP4571690.1 4-hydroxy-tetrahydrodipicolinate synthase [Pseudomonas sp. LPH60]BCT33176.1 4-hydroxy-tetrahydrodipicolinate synthase [Pseudomonas protegens]